MTPRTAPPADQLDLLSGFVCVLPGCRDLTEYPGQPCRSCRHVFGDHLQPVTRDRREPTPAEALRVAEEATRQAEARDATVRDVLRARRAALHEQAGLTQQAGSAGSAGSVGQAAAGPAAGQGPVRRRNQVCWLCAERRTCTRTGQGWECDTCRDVS